MTPLRTARIKKGLTQGQLASACGVSQAHISCIEKMTEQASPSLAEKIVKKLGGEVTEEQVLYPNRFVRKPRRRIY